MKPDLEIVENVMNNAKPNECMYFDDSDEKQSWKKLATDFVLSPDKSYIRRYVNILHLAKI